MKTGGLAEYRAKVAAGEIQPRKGQKPVDQISPLQAIRRKCLDCCEGSAAEVRLCATTGCPLWLWRLGRRPATVRERTPEWLDPCYVEREAAFRCLAELGPGNAVLDGDFSRELKARFPERWAEVTGRRDEGDPGQET